MCIVNHNHILTIDILFSTIKKESSSYFAKNDLFEPICKLKYTQCCKKTSETIGMPRFSEDHVIENLNQIFVWFM